MAQVSGQTKHHIQTVFIVLMENHNWTGGKGGTSIKGNRSAPYINNTLLPVVSHAEQYFNPPGIHPSLPNYLWLEAGMNFGILDDNPPSINSQTTTNHLVTFLNNAKISWKAYEEDMADRRYMKRQPFGARAARSRCSPRTLPPILLRYVTEM